MSLDEGKDKKMNDQIASLKFYLTIIANANEYSVADLAGHRADCEEFVEDALSDFTNRFLEKQITRIWTSASAPLPLAALDIPRYYDEAVRAIGPVSTGDTETKGQANPGQFEKYIVEECEKDEEAKRNLRNDVNSLWNRLEGFADKNNGRAYGLAVGRVQSGKTRNYIGLMFKAIDEGFNTVIVLTSKSNQLALQTYDRVEEWIGLRRFGLANCQMLSRIRKDNEGNGVGIDWCGDGWLPSKVNVGIIIKNAKGHLDEVHDWLGGLGEENLKRMKLLFIDDESDNATPNSNSAADPEIKDERSLETFIARIEERGRSDADCGKIAKWVRVVSGKTASDKDSEPKYIEKDLKSIQEILRSNTKYSKLFDTLQRNDAARQILKVSTTGTVGLIEWDVLERVFKRKATGNNFPNQAQFRALLNYVFGIQYERSKINHLISEIVCSAKKSDKPVFNYGRMMYVGYTATPFANMINENPAEDPLCPDCIKPLSISSRYFGLDRIYGTESKYDDCRQCRMNIVREIPSEDIEGWIRPIQNQQILGFRVTDAGVEGSKPAPEEIIDVKDQEDEVASPAPNPWKSLVEAIQWAFCTAAARRVMRKNSGEAKIHDTKAEIKHRWTTMLFNLSHLVDQGHGAHAVQQRIVQAYIDYFSREDNREAFLEQCRMLWEREAGEFSVVDFENACSGYGKPTPYPSWEDVKSALCDWFLTRKEKVRVVQLNASTDERIEYNDEKSGDWGDILWFVCGGNAISRGLTLHGLTVSYFDRIKRGSTVDSITQMGRWFGYRQGYELLPRIWMSSDTIEEVKNIARIEGQLHESLDALYEDSDGQRSIREGRDAHTIRDFGRKLSGRDANSERFAGGNSYDVFNCVLEDSSQAIAATGQLVSMLQNGRYEMNRPVDDYGMRLHERHRYVWKDVDGKIFVEPYLKQMQEVAYCGASRDKLSGLLSEIKFDADIKWNVVIGSPERSDEDAILSGVAGLVDVHMRMRQDSPNSALVGGGLRVGHATIAGQSFLSTIPSRFVGEGERRSREKNHITGDVLGNIKTVEEVYGVVAEVRNQENGELLASLLNPTLVIDFVRFGNRSTYVLLSYYWYGHSYGSYIRSVISGGRSSLVMFASKNVCENSFLSFETLCNGIKECGAINNFDQKAFEIEIREECARTDSDICWVDETECDKAGLTHPLICSRKFAEESDGDLGLRIGQEIYAKGVKCLSETGTPAQMETDPSWRYGYDARVENLLNGKGKNKKGWGDIPRDGWKAFSAQNYLHPNAL